MGYSELIKITYKAQEDKPSFGSPCNNCGWCCLTEVCPIGVSLTGSRQAPCSLLNTEGDKHYCSLAEVPEIRSELSIGEGCDAKTQIEIIKELSLK